MSEALRLAHELILAMRDTDAEHWDTLEEAAAELRRLHAELERKSDAIQRLWKERDELRSECRVLVRQNGEWQELTAELVEALRSVVAWMDAPDESAFSDTQLAAARAALAKVEASNGS